MALAKKLEAEDCVSTPEQIIGGGSSLPKHIAIIMDGNRRWARAQGLPGAIGHYRGAEAARRTIIAATKWNIPYLTLFGFSSENWNRSAQEINELMLLLRSYLRREIEPLHEANVQLKVIGDRSKLSAEVMKEITEAERRTQYNTGLLLTIAFSYGGRSEIVQAVQRIAERVRDGVLAPEMINEEMFDQFLLTAGIPNPDLVIRTSGEKRLSNFLLWQCAYSEFVFLDTLWPDFGEADLQAALTEYANRERRYGAIG